MELRLFLPVIKATHFDDVEPSNEQHVCFVSFVPLPQSCGFRGVGCVEVLREMRRLLRPLNQANLLFFAEVDHSDVLRSRPGHYVLIALNAVNGPLRFIVMDDFFSVLEPPVIEVEKLAQGSSNEEFYV